MWSTSCEVCGVGMFCWDVVILHDDDDDDVFVLLVECVYAVVYVFSLHSQTHAYTHPSTHTNIYIHTHHHMHGNPSTTPLFMFPHSLWLGSMVQETPRARIIALSPQDAIEGVLLCIMMLCIGDVVHARAHL